MAIDTKKVRGRRKVRYSSFDDLVAEAEAMARRAWKSLRSAIGRSDRR